MDERLHNIQSACEEVYFYECASCGDRSPAAVDEVTALHKAEGAGEFVNGVWYCRACARTPHIPFAKVRSRLAACPVCGKPQPYRFAKGAYHCAVCGAEISEDDILSRAEANPDYWRHKGWGWSVSMRQAWGEDALFVPKK